MKYMENFFVGIAVILVIFAVCLPWVLFAGEPDLIDAIRMAIYDGK